MIHHHNLSEFSNDCLKELYKFYFNKNKNLNYQKKKLKSNDFINSLFTKIENIYLSVQNIFLEINDLQNYNIHKSLFSPKFKIMKNNFYESNNLDALISNNPEQIKIISNEMNGRFISQNIYLYINNHLIYCVEVYLDYCGIKIQLNLFTSEKWSHNKNKKLYQKVIRIIKRILFIILFFKQNTCYNGEILNLDLYFINIKKKIPKKKSDKLDVENINSGFTTFSASGIKHIIIFRTEEMEKILIHELIHFFYLDFFKLECDLSDTLNISPDIELIPNESYTELITILINSKILSIELDTKITNLAYDILFNELIFGYFQCAKILYQYNFNTIDSFFKPYNDIDNLDNNHTFYQNSCIISYFFIKIALLTNIDETTSFLKQNMNNYKISCSDKTKLDYINHIKNSINLKDYTNNIHFFLKKINKKLLTKKTVRHLTKKCKLNKNKCISNKLSKHSNKINSFARSNLYQTNRMSICEM